MNALEIKGLCKRYHSFYLDHLDLTLPGGCILGLVGENGAGKSTVIRALLGMIGCDEGSTSVLGQSGGAGLRAAREEIGVVLDEVGLPGCLNAREVGEVMSGIFANWEKETYRQLLQTFSLPVGQKYKEFSRGMKMKLGIAIALSHRPKLLVLDEAMNGLDPLARDQVVELLLDFVREETHAVLISSHIVSDLEKLCDYIAFLHKGKLLLCEEKDRLKESYGVIHCSAEALAALAPDDIVGKRLSPYGAEAIVRRAALPPDLEAAPVDIEQLFIVMAKEES